MATKYYAVRRGQRAGIFETWLQAGPMVQEFKGALHQCFKDLSEAERYLQLGGLVNITIYTDDGPLALEDYKAMKGIPVNTLPTMPNQ